MTALDLLLAWALCVAILVALAAGRSARRARADAELWRRSAEQLAPTAVRWKDLALHALDLLEELSAAPRRPVEANAVADKLVATLERAGVYVERVPDPEDLPSHLAGGAPRRKPTTH